jgi:hypothetical protein
MGVFKRILVFLSQKMGILSGFSVFLGDFWVKIGYFGVIFGVFR